MARDHARVNVTIWGDPAFRALPPPAQHLYLTLWTSPDLSYAGVHDWRPARLSGLANGWGQEAIERAADCLSARHFLVIDHETEEALIRSWIRWDGLMKQPRMAISCITAYAAIYSNRLREVIVHQLLGEKERLPNLSCWSDSRVQEVLSHPAVSAKELPVPNDPFRDGCAPDVTHGLDQTQGEVWVPPTPAPTPAPHSSTPAPERGTRKRATQLPADWEPNEGHAAIATERGLDLDDVAANFRDHHTAKASTYVDWNAAFRTWLRRERPAQAGRTTARPSGRPTTDDRVRDGMELAQRLKAHEDQAAQLEIGA